VTYTEQEERLLELLKSQHQFPCAFPVKILFPSRDGRGDEIVEQIVQETRVSVVGIPSERASRKGTYTSMTASFQVGRPEQIIEVYRHLSTLDEVMSYF
jgi:putative lipoic acid-binding regulatory protein